MNNDQVDQNLWKCDDCNNVLTDPPPMKQLQREIRDPPDMAQEGVSVQFCESCHGEDSFEEVSITDVIPDFFDRCRGSCPVECSDCIGEAIEEFNSELDINN